MSTTKGKAGTRPRSGPIPAPARTTADRSPEVLTLGEAAGYLRLAEDAVLRLADLQELPGRRIGSEWRFLKTALQDWLRTSARMSGKEALLALAGAWKDAPDIEDIVREAHRRRGRPLPEPEE